MNATVARVVEIVVRRKPTQHVVMNAAKYVLVWRDADLQNIIASCDLVSADGQSVVWAARLLGRPLPARVAGIDLFDQLLSESERRGWRCYFLGARREILGRAVRKLLERHPQLVVAGCADGYWTDEKALISMIRASSPDLLFVALPSPRKERWIASNIEDLGVPFVMGVGGTLDVVAGAIRRAPNWAQAAGLEWVFRLAQEPRRMFLRYIVGNTMFICGVVRALIWRRPEVNPFKS